MPNCKNCKANFSRRGTHYVPDADRACYMPMTNADKYFRNATDEQIAKFFEHGDEAGCHYQKGGCPVGISCRKCWLDWLKQEAEDV